MKFLLLFTLVFGFFQSSAQQSYPITFTHAGKTVYGTFTTPDGPGPFSALIINPGSGPNDRDGTVQLVGGNVECLYPDLEGETLKPYKELGDALVDSGFAVLRYDKLEFTYTTPASLGPITFHKLWLPVESAIDYVKTRSDVDTNRIVLIGHSEGSSLIPFIAKGRSDIKALISIAGARTPFDSILAYQLVHFADTCDGDVLAAQSDAAQILEYFYHVRIGNCAFLPTLLGVSACVWEDYFDATDPVAENYNEVNLPTLFLGLGLDINVPPAELVRFENEVTIDDDFWLIPDLIHYMTPLDDPHVAETLSDTIVYWLREQFLHTSISDVNTNDSELIHITPNPFQDVVTISFPNHAPQLFSIAVMDLFGKIVMTSDSKHTNQESLDLSYLPAGTYYVQISGNEFQATKKIVKK
jgi:dienelactone hydrolase